MRWDAMTVGIMAFGANTRSAVVGSPDPWPTQEYGRSPNHRFTTQAHTRRVVPYGMVLVARLAAMKSHREPRLVLTDHLRELADWRRKVSERHADLDSREAAGVLDRTAQVIESLPDDDPSLAATVTAAIVGRFAWRGSQLRGGAAGPFRSAGQLRRSASPPIR